MSLITGIPIRDSIHTDFSTGISGWGGYRTELTGEFTRQGGNVSGRYGEFSKDIQEYNRKINTLSGVWSDTGMFLTPYNAGFRYTGTGDFNKWDVYSVLFDGVDEHVTTSADSTLASKSYSFWAKSTKTTRNAVFGHSGMDIFAFNWSGAGTHPILYTDGYYYHYWDYNDAVVDGNWHHHVVYFEHDDISNSKWYVDGLLQPVEYTEDDGEADPWGNLIIGKGLSYYYDGSLDEFAVFDGELSAAQVLAIYNGGTPQSLAPYNPEVWWRMGDGDYYDILKDSSGNDYDGTMKNMESSDIRADTP